MAASLREIKQRICSLFTQVRVATNAGMFSSNRLHKAQAPDLDHGAGVRQPERRPSTYGTPLMNNLHGLFRVDDNIGSPRPA